MDSILKHDCHLLSKDIVIHISVILWPNILSLMKRLKESPKQRKHILILSNQFLILHILIWIFWLEWGLQWISWFSRSSWNQICLFFKFNLLSNISLIRLSLISLFIYLYFLLVINTFALIHSNLLQWFYIELLFRKINFFYRMTIEIRNVFSL